MLYLFPIEKFPERYSEQWYEWFKKGAESMGIDMHIIDPIPLKANLQTGEVLDVFNTNYYKALQSAEFIKMLNENKIKDSDTLLIMDGWFPSLDTILYIRQMLGLKFKIKGILHAGTWDENDFTVRQGFKIAGFSLLEEFWLQNYDELFVATQFHKNMILRQHTNINSDKIKIVNFPLKLKNEKQNERKNIICFPHRLDIEKQPNYFDAFADTWRRLFGLTDVTFVKTKEYCKTKEEYYDLLSIAKISISFATQETYGIAMLESAVFGCIPVVPNDLAYKEMYPDIFQYNNHPDYLELLKEKNMIALCYKVKNLLDNYDSYSKILPNIYSQYYNGAEEIIASAITN